MCGQQVKGGDPSPLRCNPETLSGAHVQLWGPQNKQNLDLLEQVQRTP